MHLSAVQSMIPWCFTYDKLNYAKYLSSYYADMTRLPDTHPSVHTFLENGDFAVQMSASNPFGSIPIDQAMKETINKDTQTPGGTKGFSLKPGAVQKYYLNAEYRSLFLGKLRDMVGLSANNTMFHHNDLSHSRIQKKIAGRHCG